MDDGQPRAARGRATAASACFAAIREGILSGRLAPGQKLKIDALAQQLAASINPVREALNRLSAEGLVVLEDQRGFSVAPVSRAAWRDMVEARCMIEGAALTAAIARRDAAWEEGIVLALHWLSRTPRHLSDAGGLRQTNPEWEPRHHRFHEALLAGCGSQRVLAICRDLRVQADRYRQIAATAPGARRSHNDEHDQIARAALAGEAGAAVAALTDHYRNTLSVVETYFDAMA